MPLLPAELRNEFFLAAERDHAGKKLLSTLLRCFDKESDRWSPFGGGVKWSEAEKSSSSSSSALPLTISVRLWKLCVFVCRSFICPFAWPFSFSYLTITTLFVRDAMDRVWGEERSWKAVCVEVSHCLLPLRVLFDRD